MARKSWKDRKKKLGDRTRERSENREGKSSHIFSFKNLPEGMEVKWADKLKKGRESNNFDFLPFEVTEEWYQRAMNFDGKRTGIEPGEVDYKLEYCTHRGVGPEKVNLICLREMFGEECAVCERRDWLLENAAEEDPDGKLATSLKPKWRVLYNIIDLNGDQDIRLWDHSYHLFEKHLQAEIALNEEEGLVYFWGIDEDGMTVKWRAEEKTRMGYKFIEANRIDFAKRDPYDEAIFDEVYPLDQLLVIPTSEQVARIMLAMPEDSAPEKEKEKEKEEPPTRNRSRQRFSKQEKEEEKDENLCSKGLKFGEDFNKHNECNDCPDEEYNECQDKAQGDPEPEPEPEQKEPEPEQKEPEQNTRNRRRSSSDSSDSSQGTTRRRRRR